MDELTDTFGALSTNAAEWTPSEFNPKVVKEFVPGQGWAPQTSSQQEHQGQHQQQDTAPLESSVPAGPQAASAATDTDDLAWRIHRDRALTSTQQMEPSDPRHNAIPLPYCNAACLGQGGLQSQQQRRRRFGYPSAVYRVTNRHDGQLYCLQRFENVRCVNHSIAVAVTERWQQRVRPHFSLATLHSCFVSQRAVFCVHQYIPGAQSLEDYVTGSSLASSTLPEPMVWSILSQLVAGMRVVHRARLAIRTVQAQHILVTTTTTGGSTSTPLLRIHIGSLGILDALEFEARKQVELLQQDDLVDLGRLLLVLTHTAVDRGRMDPSRYSPDLHNLAMRLLQANQHQTKNTHPPVSLAEVSGVVARCCAFDELDTVYRALDRSEAVVASEYNASRAFRLLIKMGFVNERPEFGPNRRWAQSGDCFVLSLFRDYVFHQADSQGQPIMDLGHVVTALNKLDAADEEKVVLTSRDGKSLMVVSFADVARCLEGAFHELCAGAVAPSAYQF